MTRTAIAFLAVLAAAALGASAVAAEAASERVAPIVAPRPVDLAICLDTSGSMSGLIESAKQKLWAVVNELATQKPRPSLRVALYHYGNSGLSRDTGWVQQLCPLTTDLDTVYGRLFPLRTNGGTEYVARVIRAATKELEWSKDRRALRIIFVAGNEPATQDEQTYKLQDICKAAAGSGIIVNTIHCGPDEVGRRTGWADAAAWADGQYAFIDQDRGTVVINTPHDKKLAELSAKLNTTYVAFGAEGQRGAANQSAQDANAAKMAPGAAAERAQSKASGLYVTTWDLVDARNQKDFDLAKVKGEDLPEEMRKMTLEERRAFLDAKAKERAEIQSQIKELSEKRDAYIKEQMAKQDLSDKASLDRALREAIRTQYNK